MTQKRVLIRALTRVVQALRINVRTSIVICFLIMMLVLLLTGKDYSGSTFKEQSAVSHVQQLSIN